MTAKEGKLMLKFHMDANLTAALQYMGHQEWLLKYDNIEYGIFATNFNLVNGRVALVVIRQYDFVEIYLYTFSKKK